MIDNSNHSRKDGPILAYLGGPHYYYSPPGKASNYIAPVSVIQPGDKMVIYCRVSEHTQNHNGNLNDQELNLRNELAKLGAIIVGVVRREKSGWDCKWLAEAVEKARAHGAKLVAETTSRFIRNPDYHSKNAPDAQATKEDLQGLAVWTDGVTLVTLLHPDASAGEERSYQTRRGQDAKGKKGGRPRKQLPGRKKERRRELIQQVLTLDRKGWSRRAIASRISVPKSTIQDWIRRYDRHGLA